MFNHVFICETRWQAYTSRLVIVCRTAVCSSMLPAAHHRSRLPRHCPHTLNACVHSCNAPETANEATHIAIKASAMVWRAIEYPPGFCIARWARGLEIGPMVV